MTSRLFPPRSRTAATTDTDRKPRRSRRERIARAAMGVVVVAAVTGVAVSGLPALTMAATPHLPVKNLDAWTMPLDRYVPVSVVISDYVENLSTVPCMADAGFAWNIPERDIQAAAARAGDATVPSPLTLAEAQERGYHPPSTVDPGRSAEIALNAKHLSDDEEHALEVCTASVRKTHPRLTGRQSQASLAAVRLSNAAFDAAEHDGAVTDAEQNWRGCMASAGIKGVPDTPTEMPSPSMISELGINLEGSTASRREKDLAATDVRCQLDSGYRKALYDAEWERQASVPKADAAQFKTVGDAIAQNRRTVLAELAAMPSTR